MNKNSEIRELKRSWLLFHEPVTRYYRLSSYLRNRDGRGSRNPDPLGLKEIPKHLGCFRGKYGKTEFQITIIIYNEIRRTDYITETEWKLQK